MRKYKYLTKPNKYPEKFIKEMKLCVKKKQFMTLSFVIREKKILKLIRKFNDTPVGNLTNLQIKVINAIFQACLLIDDYNDLFFKDIKVKFLDNYEQFRDMQLKLPYARLQLRINKGDE